MVVEPLPSTITDGEWTLLYAMGGEPVELYHTASDPNQGKNLFAGNEKDRQGPACQFVDFWSARAQPRRMWDPGENCCRFLFPGGKSRVLALKPGYMEEPE